MMLLRQLASIIVLPGVVAALVPIWIVRRDDITLARPGSPGDVALLLIGVCLLAVGLLLFGASLFHFWRHGRGTLAPWDPPRNFVVQGPYRFVRNPMISGVIIVLVAEACIFRARPLGDWAVLFALINAVYIPILEEPGLVARFGEPYVRYTKAVRRFVPRLRPWNGR